MEQMLIAKEAIVDINYGDTQLPSFVQQFKPTVFREGNAFCVLLGPDPQAGIFGCGDTLESALKDWDNHLSDEIGNPTAGNETTRYILDNLNTF